MHIGATLSSGFSMCNRYIELTSMAHIAPHFGAGIGDVTLTWYVSCGMELPIIRTLLNLGISNGGSYYSFLRRLRYADCGAVNGR